MRKFKRFPSRSLRFSSLLILTGALLVLAAFAPRANASLIAYYNFEGTDTPSFPVNISSKPPAVFFTSDNNLIISPPNNNALVQAGGLNFNVAPGDNTPNNTGLGFNHSGANSPLTIEIPLFSPQGFFQDMSLSFAINALGNGFNSGFLQFSTDGGATWTTFFSASIPSAGVSVVSVAVPAGANNHNLLALRIELTGGQSNGADLQNIIDNIQVNGTIVPEPATVAGGLLGVLGLCWFQRRRLRSLLPLLRRA
jgi:hypothetical protein